MNNPILSWRIFLILKGLNFIFNSPYYIWAKSNISLTIFNSNLFELSAGLTNINLISLLIVSLKFIISSIYILQFKGVLSSCEIEHSILFLNSLSFSVYKSFFTSSISINSIITIGFSSSRISWSLLEYSFEVKIDLLVFSPKDKGSNLFLLSLSN